MSIIRVAPLCGPLFHTLTLNKTTTFSSVLEPLVVRKLLAGGSWYDLFSATAASNVARGLDHIMQTVFDPSRASRLFKKHLTPDSVVSKLRAAGIPVQWEEAVLILLILAKVGITGYDPTFELRDDIDIEESNRYPSLEFMLNMATAQSFLENEFYPLLGAHIVKANTHVNDGIITEEGKMRTYFMGTDVPSQIISEFHTAWKKIATRASSGTLLNCYDTKKQLPQLQAALATFFYDPNTYHEKYGLWKDSIQGLFDYANFTAPLVLDPEEVEIDVTDPSTGSRTSKSITRYRGATKEKLLAVIKSIPAVEESMLVEAGRRVCDYLKGDHKVFVVDDGVSETGRLAPFTRLASTSAILPSYDARPIATNPVVAISEVTANLYGQCFLLSPQVTAGVSSLIKDAHNLIVDTYNQIKQAYVTADAPFTKRDFLDRQTAEAVKKLDPVVIFDAVVDGDNAFIPATVDGRVKLHKQFIGDVASTLAAVGFVGFDNDFRFEYLDDAFTCCATDDRFTYVAKEPFYGIPLGDEIPFVNTIKAALCSKYNTLMTINPDDFKSSVVLPKIKGRRSVRATQVLAKYGITRPTIFLKDYFFSKDANLLGSALKAIWMPTTTLTEDVDDIIIGAAQAILAKAVPLFGDWVRNQILTQHSMEHYSFASHAEQKRLLVCTNMSCTRLYIDLVKQFSDETADALTWIVRVAGQRSAANYFNMYLDKAGK